MIIRITAFTWNGAALAGKLADALASMGEDAQAFAAPKIAEDARLPSTEGIAGWTAQWFASADALVFIGAAGIAVRAIAQHVASKHSDPAVLCLDEKGKYVISLLSGHEGGANLLTKRVAALTGGTAVLTTATDVNHCFAVDAWIAQRGYTLFHPENVGAFALAELRGDAVGLISDFPVHGFIPKELGNDGSSGLYVGIYNREPFENTVQAVPKIVTAGIGCRRGTEATTIKEAVSKAFQQEGLLLPALAQIATIDLKKDESGLLICADELGAPIRFYTSCELEQVEGDFSASERVRRITGVDNVCERAAVLASKGKLILKKRVYSGVTVALAVSEHIVSFVEEGTCV